MGCVELALFAEQYNENLVKELYANLTEESSNLQSPAYGQLYVRGHVIDFSSTNIAHYLGYPHYSNIEGTGLEEETDFDELTKVLTGDAGAILPKTNRLTTNFMKMPHKALFRFFFLGNQLPTTNVTAILKERAELLYVLATREKINICTVIFRNIFNQIDQNKGESWLQFVLL